MTKPTRLQPIAFRDYRHIRGAYGNEYRETRCVERTRMTVQDKTAKYEFGLHYNYLFRDRNDMDQEPCWRCPCGREMGEHERHCKPCGYRGEPEYR